MMLTEYDEKLHEETLLNQGAKKVNRLIKILIDHARADEIERAVTDMDYQEQLFKEFGL